MKSGDIVFVAINGEKHPSHVGIITNDAPGSEMKYTHAACKGKIKHVIESGLFKKIKSPLKKPLH